jgi:hypothetical protein
MSLQATVYAFAQKVSTNHSIPLTELLEIWNTSNPNFKISDKSDCSSPQIQSNVCTEQLKTGPNAGKACGKVVSPGSNCCPYHLKKKGGDKVYGMCTAKLAKGDKTCSRKANSEEGFCAQHSKMNSK